MNVNSTVIDTHFRATQHTFALHITNKTYIRMWVHSSVVLVSKNLF